MPRLRAAATPAFSCATTRTGPGKAEAIAPVASREPSSTTTTSRSSYVCQSTEEIAAPTVSPASKAGMTTEMRGSPEALVQREEPRDEVSSEPAPSTCGRPRRAGRRARGRRARGAAQRPAPRAPRRRAARSARRRRARAGLAPRSPRAACPRRAPRGRSAGGPPSARRARPRPPRPSAPGRPAARRRRRRGRRRPSPPRRAPGRVAAARRRRSRAPCRAPRRARGSRARGSSARPAGRRRPRAGVPGTISHSRSSSARSAGGGAGPTAFGTVASGMQPCSSSAAATPGPHATGARPEARTSRTVAGQSSSGPPWTLTRPGGRGRGAWRGPSRGHHRVVRVDDVGPRVAHRPPHGASRSRDAPRLAPDEGERVRLGVELRGERAGRGRDGHLVAGLAGAAVGRDEDPLRAAGAELLDHVEDPHSSS